MACLISLHAAPLACYGLTRIFPTPNAKHLIILVYVQACAHAILRVLVDRISYGLAHKYEYFVEGKTTNRKFVLAGQCFMSAMSVLLPIFYTYAGPKLGLQLTNFLTTIAFLSLTSRAIDLTKLIAELATALLAARKARPLTESSDPDRLEGYFRGDGSARSLSRFGDQRS